MGPSISGVESGGEADFVSEAQLRRQLHAFEFDLLHLSRQCSSLDQSRAGRQSCEAQRQGSYRNLRVCMLVAQSCMTLCDPMDCSLLGYSVHGILQARILEWVAISFSKGSSQPGSKLGLLHWQIDSLLLSHQGSIVIISSH